MQETPQAKRYFISGFVQGVGYRFFVERVANRLDIAGYVRNLRDGRVEAYAIGAGAQLAAFREELERGPHGSSVMSVDEKDAPIDSHYQNGFSIEHTF